MLGVLLALIASVCWGFSAILVRLGVESLRPSTGTWVSLIPGAVISMGLALTLNLNDIKALVAGVIFWFALSGLLNFAFGRLLNTVSINLVGVSKAAPLFGTAPLFATVLSVIFLGEKVTPWLIVGTLCVVGGISLITSEQGRG